MKSPNSTLPPVIRKLKSDELDELLTLMELAFSDTINENKLDTTEVRKAMKRLQTPLFKMLQKLTGTRIEFYIAEVDNTIASAVRLNISKGEVYVGDLMTHPKYQRQGLARKLLQFSFVRARELGLKKIRLDVRSENVNAVGLYTSEGFETIFHSGRFGLDSMDFDKSRRNGLIIRENPKIAAADLVPMLDACFPTSYLDFMGREKILRNILPSRAARFFAKHLEGERIHNYAFYLDDDKVPRVIITASQSRLQRLIRLSSPILIEEDANLLLEVIPKILDLETSYSGKVAALITCSVHRIEAISYIEQIGFRKLRDNLTMVKWL